MVDALASKVAPAMVGSPSSARGRTQPRTTGGSAVKILAVADLFPWPPTRGNMLREARNVAALSRLGEVDLFTLYDTSGPSPVMPSGVRLRRFGMAAYPAVQVSRRARALWTARPTLPEFVAVRQGDARPRQSFEAFADRSYDVAWFAGAAVWHWLGRPDRGPTIVDLDDLKDRKARQALEHLRVERASGAVDRGRQSWAESLRLHRDAQGWHRLQDDTVRLVDRVALCSEEDILRLAAPNAVMIPNTLRQPRRLAGRAQASSPPTVMFPASFDYWPNVEAARWLVGEIGPTIRAALPGTVLRLAGRSVAETEAMAVPGQVSVSGLVPSMADELARADVVMVPLRSGSGTRLKIIEAMAHGVPVVSTRLGAEGLDVADGVHLLLADTTAGLVDAVVRLQGDAELRASLVANARARFQQCYEDRAGADLIRQVVDALHRTSSTIS